MKVLKYTALGLLLSCSAVNQKKTASQIVKLKFSRTEPTGSPRITQIEKPLEFKNKWTLLEKTKISSLKYKAKKISKNNTRLIFLYKEKGFQERFKIKLRENQVVRLQEINSYNKVKSFLRVQIF